MSTNDFATRYPTIERFVRQYGWIEIGISEYINSFVRLYDLGGTVWESEESYPTIEDALAEAEKNLIKWFREVMGEEE